MPTIVNGKYGLTAVRGEVLEVVDLKTGKTGYIHKLQAKALKQDYPSVVPDPPEFNADTIQKERDSRGRPTI
jgi:hypothetical protein